MELAANAEEIGNRGIPFSDRLEIAREKIAAIIRMEPTPNPLHVSLDNKLGLRRAAILLMLVRQRCCRDGLVRRVIFALYLGRS